MAGDPLTIITENRSLFKESPTKNGVFRKTPFLKNYSNGRRYVAVGSFLSEVHLHLVVRELLSSEEWFWLFVFDFAIFIEFGVFHAVA